MTPSTTFPLASDELSHATQPGRRSFLKGCGAALMCGGLALTGTTPTLAASTLSPLPGAVEALLPPVLTAPQPFFRPVDHLTLDDFAPHLGKAFPIHALNPQDGALIFIALRLEQAQSLPFALAQSGEAALHSFQLSFYGPLDKPLGQGTYEMAHPTRGSILMFLVPVGQDDKMRRYEAIFNRAS